ncbi:GH1 family beta-glucosidase [Alteromonas gilva]|uniref:Beta-glucosidase n=1 Tax=Alteromonas gilva TaxID=2987522 RepID=A0ABT5L4R7_9ALTE|nr:GH1 family beta-glucosidase [Alteromonas gilva]MDC8832030.1 GH1 family beta-glucosidase [Alteromonas gilva]
MANGFKVSSLLSQPDFVVGVATSSFQIEGGAEFREPCIWDTFCKVPGAIKDASDGHLACDHYSRWREDIAMVADLGFDAYRFSVCWPRIICADGSVNQSGLDFYISILDELKRRNLKAFVTLYHWELPQYLEDQGGWLNRNTAHAFATYTDVVSQAFGQRVDTYTTLNEPFCSAYLGYEAGIHAPGKKGAEYGKKAAHNLLLAHGLSMQVLARNVPHIRRGIVLNFTPFYAASASPDDERAVQLAHDHFNDWYLRPLLCGEYPDLLNQLPHNQRPDIQPGDMNVIAQPLDYLGVNYYTRSFVAWDDQTQFKILPPPDQAPVSAMNWEIFPDALRELLLKLDNDYTLPPLYVTENGMASDDQVVRGEVKDETRVNYLRDHMQALAQAMDAGVDIRGYFVWSLMDNFEWAEGYLKRFGIVHVDFTTQQRLPKQSALLLSKWLLQRSNETR